MLSIVTIMLIEAGGNVDENYMKKLDGESEKEILSGLWSSLFSALYVFDRCHLHLKNLNGR